MYSIFELLPQLHPTTSERLSMFFKLPKETSKFYVPTNLVEDFTNLNKQHELIPISFETASQEQAAYSHVRRKLHSRRIRYRDRRPPRPKTIIQNLCTYSIKTLNIQLKQKCQIMHRISSIYIAFVEFGHLMWGSTFPVIVFTDNRSVTRFFQAKLILPALWNAGDYVLQYNFDIAHVACPMITAADFLSRTEVNTIEKLEMSIRNDTNKGKIN